MRKIYLVFLFLAIAITSFCQQTFTEKYFNGMNEVSASEKRAYRQNLSRQEMKSAASDNFDVNFYRCEWQLDPTVRYIKGKITSYFTVTTATNTISFDLHNTLTVDSIKFRNNLLSFTQTPNHALNITLPVSLAVNQKDSIAVYYQGVPANDGSGSFVTRVFNGLPVLWTLSEPYGSKDWWPCKNGTTDKADSIDIVMTYPDAYSTSSNGLLVMESSANGSKTSYWKHRYPIASYLVAISGAKFVVENDSVSIKGKNLPMKMYSYPGYNEYYRYAVPPAKLCLPKFSSMFGEYPFIKETYSQTQYEWGGGMEHQTNSFITGVYDQLIVHELGHQWFGDKVTCRSWQDIWLNEGFATYTQHLYIEEVDKPMVTLYLQYYIDQVVVRPDGSVKVYDTTDENKIFNYRTTYVKGGCLVHMLRWRLGDSLFFKAITTYLNDPLVTYGTATTADLKRNLEQVSGQNFTEFFKDWFEGQGYPSYQVQWSANKNNWVKLTLAQTTSDPSVSFFEMPVPVLLRKGNRDTTMVLNHTKSGEEFWVNPGFLPDTVIFDPQRWLLSAKNTVTKIPSASENANDVRIYPNPIEEKIKISFVNPTTAKLTMRIINAAGQTVYRKEIGTPGNDEYFEIPASTLSKGIYWLQINGDDGYNITRKIFKK